MTIDIALNELNYGHDAVPPINARRVGREDGIEAYAASIASHGLIQALNVRQIDGKWYVADGNKRLAALHLRAERGEIRIDEPVKCDETIQTGDAEELSVAANFIRTPLHEADTYETFRELEARGMTEAQIAARFGIDAQRVHRMLALGHLSPLILDAWRNDELGGNPVDCVRAFTLAKTVDQQEAVFRQLKKDNRMQAHIVRSQLGGNNHAAEAWLKTAGLRAYKAAGGAIVEDLFGDQHVIHDVDLAERLAEERIERDLAALKEEGWAWVSRARDMPSYAWKWQWEKLQPAGAPAKSKKGKDKPTWTAEQLEKAGAVVEVDHDGAVELVRGVVKPATAKKTVSETTDGASESQEKVPTISNALAHRLSIQATKATQQALAEEPRLGLIALLAGFLTKRDHYTATDTLPITAYHQGFEHEKNRPEERFEDAFQRLLVLSDAEQFALAAKIAASALSLQLGYSTWLPFDKAVNPLVSVMDETRLNAALRQHFDAEDYFGGAPKSFTIQAISEAINEDEARKAEKLKKAELVEYALKNVVPTGWLPLELRTPNYDGPRVAVDPDADIPAFLRNGGNEGEADGAD